MLLVLAAAAACEIDVGLTHEHEGTLYMALATIAPDDARSPCSIPMPAHGRLHLTRADGGAINTVVAPVANGKVPAAYRRLRGKQVVVDGSCTATVQSFVVLAMHSINFEFDDQPSTYTAAYALEYGTPVLAAKLRGCTHGVLARDATRPNLQPLHPIAADGLVSAAQAQYLANDLPTGDGALDLSAPNFQWDIVVLDHPTTGQRYVSVRAVTDDPALAPPSDWEVYEVLADGRLTPRHPTNRPSNGTPMFVDLDGELVVVIRWMHAVSLETLGGDRKRTLWPNAR